MKKPSFESICVHEQAIEITTQPQQMPMMATSSFRFSSIDEGIRIFKGEQTGDVYGRYGNPTIRAVEQKLARMAVYGSDLEAHGILFSSGMSAISTLMLSILNQGDAVLTQGNLYGGTTELLMKTLAPLGITPIFTNLKDLNNVENHLKQNQEIKLIYFETPANPTLECVDIKAINELARKYGKYTAADNTFSTPYLQQPILMDTDFEIHSTTKYLNGHGNSIAGIVISKHIDLMKDTVWKNMKLLGTNSNAFDAWLLNLGLKTLVIRMDKHCENAMNVAKFLENHEKVEKVNYIGLATHPDHLTAKKQMSQFGGMISFEIKGGLDAGISFMNKIEFCSLAPTLGDIDTLVLHPASMSHVNVPKELRLQNGITDGLIRLSVGIESVEDIIADLEQALQ